MKDVVFDLGRSALQIITLIGAIWCLLFVDTCFRTAPVPPQPSTSTYRLREGAEEGTPSVRVLLEDKTINRQNALSFRSNERVDLYREKGSASSWKTLPADSLVRIRRAGDHLVVNGTRVDSTPFVFQPEGRSQTRVGGRVYRGAFHIKLHGDGGLQVINVVPMNQYLWSVLGGEIKLSWHMEALRTQAVIARTFALWETHFQKTKNPAANYDVRSSVSSQRYPGISEEGPRSRMAVKSTRGLVLIYQSRMLHAYYHSTCGGRTESLDAAIEVEAPPVPSPLKGGVPCPWDDVSTYHRWSFHVEEHELRRKLDEVSGTVHNISVVERTENKRVKKLAIKTEGGTVTVSGTTFRRSLQFPDRQVRSNWFYIGKAGADTYRIRGRGWGHGAGLCQMGAVGAAREGISFDDILNHYYPGVSIMFEYK